MPSCCAPAEPCAEHRRCPPCAQPEDCFCDDIARAANEGHVKREAKPSAVPDVAGLVDRLRNSGIHLHWVTLNADCRWMEVINKSRSGKQLCGTARCFRLKLKNVEPEEEATC